MATQAPGTSIETTSTQLGHVGAAVGGIAAGVFLVLVGLLVVDRNKKHTRGK